MPAPTVGPKKPPAGKGLGKGKIAGLPIPVVLGGVVVAVLIGLYIKNKAAAASTTTGTTTAATDPNAIGGGTAGASTSPDSTQALADALNNLSYYLGGGTASSLGTGGTLDTSAPALSTVTNSATTAPTAPATSSPLDSAIAVSKQTGANVYVTPGGSVLVGPDAKMAVGPNLVNLSQQIPVATENFAQAAVAKSNALAAAGAAQPYGGVASTVTNKKTGVVTTTYASGRIVQQAPGKTAYVAKK